MKQTILSRVRRYLAHRRSFGYKLRTEGQMLLNFARYAGRIGHSGPLTQQLALRWANLPKTADPLYRARRLEVVRCFAKYQAGLEPQTEIPPRHILGPSHRRKTPHLYAPSQVRLMLIRAGKLDGSLRPKTYRTLIGLLASTGLRISEALSLSINDVDLQQATLTVRESKYHHTRLLPLHSTVLAQLRRYACLRLKRFPLAQHFFVSDRGQRFAYSTVKGVFLELSQGINPAPGWRRVRLHDLRHTFACRVLLQWQRSKRGAVGRIPVLSRYLGHRRVNDTFWYLSAFPELISETAKRFKPPFS